MAKKPLPVMEPVNLGKNPPFVPEVFKTTVGPPNPTLRESHVGLYAKLYDYSYAGQNQTGTINIRIPKPVGLLEIAQQITLEAPMESGPSYSYLWGQTESTINPYGLPVLPIGT